MTRKRKTDFWLGVAALALCGFVAACVGGDTDGGSDGGSDGSSGSGTPSDGADDMPGGSGGDSGSGGDTPPGPADPVAPDLPAGWFEPPGELIAGTASAGGSFGYVLRDDEGNILNPAPGILFPIAGGPAFLNSQIMMPGGFGYGSVPNPNPGDQNDPQNYSYPWRDNFCEIRDSGNSRCGAGTGHQGQDIRPATCENGRYFAVAPEPVRIRNVGTHGVNAFGLETGILYTFLHLDRPLSLNEDTGAPVKKNDVLTAGQPIGPVSNKTSPNSDLACFDRCTTLHLHYEMWSGAVEFSNSFARGPDSVPLPPYTSLIESYVSMIDTQPDGEDWTSARPQVPISECARP